jgi:hypothetical protein
MRKNAILVMTNKNINSQTFSSSFIRYIRDSNTFTFTEIILNLSCAYQLSYQQHILSVRMGSFYSLCVYVCAAMNSFFLLILLLFFTQHCQKASPHNSLESKKKTFCYETWELLSPFLLFFIYLFYQKQLLNMLKIVLWIISMEKKIQGRKQ